MASKLAFMALALLLIACASPGTTTQSESALRASCPGGEIALLRVSRIPEGGSVEGFRRAVEAQNAWYRHHGFTQNEQVVAAVLEQHGEQWSQSGAEIVTIHRRPPESSEIRQDSDWAAFVTQFRANSVIELERWICLPH